MNNQRGQAAILVALMFNVLFVFFAMAINVALVVHDKINLQNSADLAVYYAATKQAEVLNAIAHTNYQMRQSYKLLAWRYRALGTLGIINVDPHPIWTESVAEEPYSLADRASVCVWFQPTWEGTPPNENLCNRPELKIPPMPKVTSIASFLGWNVPIEVFSDRLITQYTQSCDRLAAYNLWYAMSIWHAYRLDQRNRKQLIYALAKNLSNSNSTGDFVDLDGNSVLAGARETFFKNLTYTNLTSFESGGKFEMMNSLAGVDVAKWLPEVQISPAMTYTDAAPDPSSCQTFISPISQVTGRAGALDQLMRPLSAGGLGAKDLLPWAKDGTNVLRDSDYQFAIGVEKNPWYMPYVGLKVETQPRQLFIPLTNGIRMIARTFAKPFGGRIGPWYKSKWERSAAMSDGQLTDELMAPRVEGGIDFSENEVRRLPNYSRFPGDKLGLKSKLALGSMWWLGNRKKTTINFDYYRNIKSDFDLSTPNDILPWDYQKNLDPDIRFIELAAIAPDLFDITYYSIEPNFYKNYFERIRNHRTALGIPSNLALRPDLGSSVAKPEFSVQDQMAIVRDKMLQRAEAFYFVRDRVHLLTSWLPGPGTYNYEVAESLGNFGKCQLPDDNLKYKTPGSCAAGGGRTGYSVKLISRDALLSNRHRIGGPEAAPGAILNPPDASNDW